MSNKKIYLLIILFAATICITNFGSVSAANPPYANFESNTSSGTGPVYVQFHETTIGNVSSWKWNFGDNKTSTDKNPTHTYTRPGKYNVTLTCINQAGISSITKNNFITVKENRFLNPGFETGDFRSWNTCSTTSMVNNSNGTKSAHFSASSDQNSNYVSQGINLTYVGSISFWGRGESGSSQSFYVYVDSNLIQQFTSKSTGFIDKCKWNFGDGTTSTSYNPLHYYTNGSYTVILTVTGPGGVSSSNTSFILKNVDTIKPTACANLSSGTYNTTKSVKLAMSEKGTIYYTLNGKTPTSSSAKYTGLIKITNTTLLKFVAVDLANNYSPVYTKKYTIDTVQPTIISTKPNNYSTGFSRTGQVTLKFSENVIKGVNWSMISVKNMKTGKKIGNFQ
jgi:PKD repeat protein